MLEQSLKDDGLILKTASIILTDFERIKVQLVGYGLIRTFVTEAVGGGLSEFAELTPLGAARQIEWSIVRDP
jgi:hypothetical protein